MGGPHSGSAVVRLAVRGAFYRLLTDVQPPLPLTVFGVVMITYMAARQLTRMFQTHIERTR